MSKAPRILNLTRGFHLKPSQALRAIENCACAWVDYGKTIRDLSLAESISARNRQAKDREPLPNAEIPGLRYEPSTSGQALTRNGYELTKQANLLCMERA